MTGPINCRECLEFLMDYLDGALPESQRSLFERHLDDCPPCVDYMRTYQQSIRISVSVGRCFEEEEIGKGVPEELVEAILATWRQLRGADPAGQPPQGPPDAPGAAGQAPA